MLCCPAGDVPVYLNMTNLKNKYNIASIFAQTPLFTACEFLDCLRFVMRHGHSRPLFLTQLTDT